MGLRDLFKKKEKPLPINQNPVQISDGGSFLIRTDAGKSCLILLPVWNSASKSDSFELFLSTGGEIEAVCIVNHSSDGFLLTEHYLQLLPASALENIYITHPDSPASHYPEELTAPTLPFSTKSLPETLQFASAEIHYLQGNAFLSTQYQSPRRGGKDCSFFGLQIVPDVEFMQKTANSGININFFGSIAPAAITEINQWTPEIWDKLSGRVTFVCPNAVKGVNGSEQVELLKAAGCTAAAIGTEEPV